MPIELGRAFGPEDVPGSEAVAIVDRDLVRFLWPGENPIGRRFRTSESGLWLTAVGVAGDVDLMGYADLQYPYCAGTCDFEYYRPLSQAGFGGGLVTFVLRTPGDPAALAPTVREVVRAVDPEAPVTRVATAMQLLREELDQERFVLRLVSLFTLLAIILAGTGVYGVLAYGVARRTREIGVCVALGARSEQVVSDVLKRGIGFAAAGCTLGAIGALAAHRLIRGLLYDIGPTDPVALAAATVLIAAVAIAASLGPARRAVRISPVESMRVD